MSVQWADPPDRIIGNSPYGAVRLFVEALRERPGCWALYPHPTSRQMATQNRMRFPGTEWQTRKREDGKHDLYARYIGNGDSDGG